MKVANYIGWAVMIIVANELGVESEMIDVSKEIINTGQVPKVVYSAELENAALNANKLIVEKGLMCIANEKGEKLIESIDKKYVTFK